MTASSGRPSDVSLHLKWTKGFAQLHKGSVWPLDAKSKPLSAERVAIAILQALQSILEVLVTTITQPVAWSWKASGVGAASAKGFAGRGPASGNASSAAVSAPNALASDVAVEADDGRPGSPGLNDGPPEEVGDAARREALADPPEEGQVLATLHPSIHQFDRDEWNACACSGGAVNPFVQWEFLAALEDSRSASQQQGWLPQHLALRDSAGRLLAAAPLYLKGHSYGEYVFDHAWANLYAQLGREYYPKLQCCVPFTPVTGPRLLVAEGQDAAVMQRALVSALTQVAAARKVSSVHVTFNTEEEFNDVNDAGWLSRLGIQYHWENDGYSTFEDFLAALKQSKRKSIRQERKSIAKQGLVVRRLTGDAIDEQTWDAFYQFYLDTVDRKWGSAYLTRDFFIRLGQTMGDKVLLVTAYDSNRGGELVAGALNLIGSDTLFGRNWGCKYGDMYKNLHFEICYYQAIEEAIVRGLQRVEAGAQGQHKIQRGYLPNMTYSNHLVCDPVARTLIKQFLQHEAAEMTYTVEALTKMASPYKDVSESESVAFAAVKALSAKQSSRNATQSP